MLPFLSQDRAAVSGEQPRPVHVPPPSFRSLHSVPEILRYQPQPYCRAQGQTTAHKVGLRYEAQVHDWLGDTFGYYDPTPLIEFRDNGEYRRAIPDAVLVKDHVVVFEIKHQHVPEAFWQLRRLYAPLLREYFSSRLVSCVEICRTYDPATPFPVPVVLIDDIKEWCSKPRKDLGVFQWRKTVR